MKAETLTLPAIVLSAALALGGRGVGGHRSTEKRPVKPGSESSSIINLVKAELSQGKSLVNNQGYDGSELLWKPCHAKIAYFYDSAGNVAYSFVSNSILTLTLLDHGKISGIEFLDRKTRIRIALAYEKDDMYTMNGIEYRLQE